MSGPAPLPGRGEVFIAPSLLSADFARLADEIAEVEAGGAEWLHLDVMDGHFVPNLTFGPPVVNALRKVTSMAFDAHLMVTNPDDLVDMFADAGVGALSVHQEVCPHLDRSLDAIRAAGMRPGVVINPSTSPETLVDVLHRCDYVLIMSVNPGLGGQRFIPRAIDRVRRLRAMLEAQNLADSVAIQIDGGIGPETARGVVEAGANVLVAGSAVFGRPDRGDAIGRLRASAKG